MGGADTEISDATTTVALEMAWFEPLPIRQSAARLGLRSEASTRFERGVDPYGIDTPIARFVELLAETCPDCSSSTPARSTRGVAAAGDRSCEVRISEVNRILGTSLTADDLAAAARPDRVHRVTGGGDVRTVAIPSWRPDSAETRSTSSRRSPGMYGYDRIGKTVADVDRCTAGCRCPSSAAGCCARCCSAWASPRRCRTRSWRPATWPRPGSTATRCAITNPLVAEESVLRTSLRPGLLQASPSTSRTAGPASRCSRSVTSTRRAG